MINHTFVIPAYKDSPYIEEGIQYLLEQTVESHIIITTSTPNTYVERLAKKYRLNYYINPGGPKGIADDWNFALAQAITPLVTIAHQDDIYEPDYTQTITKAFAKRNTKNILIAFTNYRDLVDDRIRLFNLNATIKFILLLPFAFCSNIGCRYLKQFILRFGDPICCPTVTFNKAALGEFAFPADYSCALDWYAWYQLSKRKGSFLYINKKLVLHRIHKESETVRQINNGVRQQEEKRIFELMWGRFFAGVISRIYTFGHKDNL